MRCYQHIGLTKKAQLFLLDNVNMIPDIVCPKCGEIISKKKEILATKEIDLFYGDGPKLRAYRMKDGSIVREVVQCEPWSSGPMGFITLECLDHSVEPYEIYDLERVKDICHRIPEFEWIVDETIPGEVDVENGRFWV